MTFYERLVELAFLCRYGVISDPLKKKIAERPLRRRFLGVSKKPLSGDK